MKKYFCDRCGTEINPLMTKHTLEYISPEFSFSSDLGDTTFHLCKDCFKEFLKWTEGKDGKQE